VDREALGRLDDRPFAVDLELDAAENLDVAAVLELRFNAGVLDRAAELAGAAVEDRDFWAVDTDDRVVDLEAFEGREQVLDRGDAAEVLAQRGRELRVHHVLGAGGDFGAAFEVGPDKDDARVGPRGKHGDRGTLP